MIGELEYEFPYLFWELAGLAFFSRFFTIKGS